MPSPLRAETARPPRSPATVRGLPHSRGRVRAGISALSALLLVGLAAPGAAQTLEPLPEPAGRVLLSVSGDLTVTNRPGRADFDRDMLRALGLRRFETQTAWTDGIKIFEGVLVRDVLARVGARGPTIRAGAVNDYRVDIPRRDFERYDVLLAMRMDGRDLTVRDKGPLWIVYPRSEHPELDDALFNQRWVWQLRSLEAR